MLRGDPNSSEAQNQLRIMYGLRGISLQDYCKATNASTEEMNCSCPTRSQSNLTTWLPSGASVLELDSTARLSEQRNRCGGDAWHPREYLASSSPVGGNERNRASVFQYSVCNRYFEKSFFVLGMKLLTRKATNLGCLYRSR